MNDPGGYKAWRRREYPMNFSDYPDREKLDRENYTTRRK